MIYIIVASSGIIDFQQKVNDKLDNGWKLHGTSTKILVQFPRSEVMFYQDMTKETND